MKTDFNLKVSKTIVAVEEKEIEADINIIIQEIDKLSPGKRENAQNILTS